MFWPAVPAAAAVVVPVVGAAWSAWSARFRRPATVYRVRPDAPSPR